MLEAQWKSSTTHQLSCNQSHRIICPLLRYRCSYGACEQWRIEAGLLRYSQEPPVFILGSPKISQSINQSINQFISRHSTEARATCGYAESKRNVLRLILNVLTDGAVRQFSEREFQSLGTATEKRRAAVSKLCGGTDRNLCVNDRSKRDWLCSQRKTVRVWANLKPRQTSWGGRANSSGVDFSWKGPCLNYSWGHPCHFNSPLTMKLSSCLCESFDGKDCFANTDTFTYLLTYSFFHLQTVANPDSREIYYHRRLIGRPVITHSTVIGIYTINAISSTHYIPYSLNYLQQAFLTYRGAWSALLIAIHTDCNWQVAKHGWYISHSLFTKLLFFQSK